MPISISQSGGGYFDRALRFKQAIFVDLETKAGESLLSLLTSVVPASKKKKKKKNANIINWGGKNI
jgi:hypothetical protein